MSDITVRGTGRTHRMLEEAVVQARSGLKVAIVTTGQGGMHQLHDMATKIASNTGGEWAVKSNMVFLTADRAVEHSPGAYRVPGCDKVLVDHAVYESQYWEVISGYLASVNY